MANLSKNISSEELGKWMAVFYKFSTKEEYNQKLQAIRCIFNAEEDKEFYNEVCEVMKKEIKNNFLNSYNL